VTAARPAIPAGLLECGVVAIARNLRPESVQGVADGLLAGGVRAFELTLNAPEADALEALEAAAGHAAGTGLDIGAGTVLSIDAAKRAIDAGARFLVMPHTDAAIVDWAAERGIPAIPGAFTPTEVLAAWRAGAAAVKLFPASVAGPAFIREIHGPFPEIPILPTGGVTDETATEFIRAGAIAVGLGGWLIGDGNPTRIAERAATVVRAVADARGMTRKAT
jgi:2-dehydro-3-deoxyphosphogluconate aldolase / (4S)-4-hydroxy-2-oxoglutarate aldolase